jgi:PAS domain S-box-containing protein
MVSNDQSAEITRLQDELRALRAEHDKALDRQTAMSDVLRIIVGSPGKLKPVLDAMLEHALRVCEATDGGLFRVTGDMLRRVASLGGLAETPSLDAIPMTPGTPLGRMVSTKKTVHIHDLAAERARFPEQGAARVAVERGGVRSAIWVPMVSDKEVIGAFVLIRREVKPFTDKQIELVETFAAQAVIAFENARLVTELRESLDRFRLLVERVTDYAIFMLDPAGVVTTWNVGAERILGYKPPEIIGRHFSVFHTAEDRDKGSPALALEVAVRDGKHESEHLRVRKDGSRLWAHVVIDPLRGEDGRLMGFAKITRDVTERHLAQAELERTRAALAQSQKMDAVGQLAGGIAHDLNNLLTTVIGNLDLLHRRAVLADQRNQSLLEAAMRGAEDGAALVAKLLAFSRKQVLEPQVIDPNKFVSSSSQLLRSALGEGINFEVVLAGGLWRAMVDPTLLEAALLNLTINSRDAMPNGGRVTIETANAFLDDDYARANDTAPGQYVMIAVSDTGEGMDEAVLARAFEPFYTTKAVGLGSGLGLSQVFGFVKQSGGHIKLYSERGRGTTVKIYLPRLVSDSEVEFATPAVKASTPAGYELILVVEDNDDVRRFTCEVLTHLGYRVLEADSAEPALRLIDQRDDISLLLTDVVLPGMNGRLLAEEALRRRPGLKIVFTSGYTQNAIVHHGRLEPGVHFVGKPYKLDSLGRKLRDVLDGS